MENRGNRIEVNNMGQVIYLCKNGFEEWYKYDEQNNLIHFRNSEGFEKWYNYDIEGKLICEINNLGRFKFYNYDIEGKLIE